MADLVQTIKNSSLEYGSIPFWSWNDKLEEEELRAQIKNMKRQGMAGFFMHARGGLETEYLSEDWYNCVAVCIDEAKKQGMQAWAYDENGWPSGFAGGILLKDEKNFASYIVCEECDEYRFDALAVYVKDGNKIKHIQNPQPDNEKNPESKYICIFQKFDSSYVDTLDADITAKFIKNTHEEYYKRFKDSFGEAMPGFFTDEPQYFRQATVWSNTLPKVFMDKYGYDIFDMLPAMFMDFEGSVEYRYDYWYLCHQLFINNYIKPIYDWCNEHNCKITGHAVEEARIFSQMWCCGGVMPFYEYEHIPGIDHLCRNIDNDLSPKQVASVAAQLGKKQVLSEMFACCGWDVSPIELKKIAEWQYAAGINLMCQHLYAYSIKGQRKNDYPASYSYHLPWQEAMGEFYEYFNRLGCTLSQGTENVNTLLIHPMHSAYLSYNRYEDYGSVASIEDGMSYAVDLLSQNQVAYHLGDEEIMAKYASCRDGIITVGNCSYSCIVLPRIYTLDEKTVSLIKEYISSGGNILLLDDAPTRINGRISDLSWIKSNITQKELFESQNVKVSLNDANIPSIRCMIRNTDKGQIYYFLNLDETKIEDVEITLKNSKNAYILNLQNLEKTPCVKTLEDDVNFTFKLTFESVQSYIVVSDEDSKACKCLTEEKTVNKASETKLDNTFELISPAKNAWTLDFAQISYDGVSYEKVRPIMMIKDLLLRSKFKGALYLKYSFDVTEIPRNVNLCVEPMRYLDATINGHTFTKSDEWWLDKSFYTADVTNYIQKGINEVILKIDYFQRDYVYYVLYGGVSESLRNCLNFDTEIENIYLYGNFTVETQNDKFVKSERRSYIYDGNFTMNCPRKTIDMTNVMKDGYPFFAGNLEIRKEFDVSDIKKTELYLTGRYSIADVYVNNKFVKKLMFTNHCDISEFINAGKNVLKIKIYNSNRNLLGPHHFIDPEPYGLGPDAFTLENQWNGEKCDAYREAYSFVHFGFDEIKIVEE